VKEERHNDSEGEERHKRRWTIVRVKEESRENRDGEKEAFREKETMEDRRDREERL